MTLAAENRGIARIVTRVDDASMTEKHIGMAVILNDQQLLTCCHVVNDAIGRTKDRLAPVPPAADVLLQVRFPYADNSDGRVETRFARVVTWGLSGDSPIDAAVLELTEPAPASAGAAVFSRRASWKRTWSCIGWDEQGVARAAPGILGPALPRGYRQLNSESGISVQIEPGYSGGAVWCNELQACVGIVALKDKPLGYMGLSYAIDAQSLAQLTTARLRFQFLSPLESRIAAFSIVVASCLCIVGFLLPTLLAPPVTPDQHVIRIYDSATGDQIHRRFSIHGDRDAILIEAPPYERWVRPSDFDIGKQWTIQCEGFNHSTVLAKEKDEEYGFSLTRSTSTGQSGKSYQELIQPSAAAIREELGVFESDIENEITLNSESPEDVTLLVHNNLQLYVDLFLIPVAPQQGQERNVLSESTSVVSIPVEKLNPIYLPAVKPGWVNLGKPLTVPNVAFVGCGSTNAQRAVALRRTDGNVTWGAIYQQNVCVLEIDRVPKSSELSGVFLLYNKEDHGIPEDVRSLLSRKE